jgi:nitrite reductase/ring-hydroxylating ferredoxin subunit
VGGIEDFEGTGLRRIEVEGRTILLIHMDSAFYAIDGLCSYKKGDLSKGTLEGFKVQCPEHGVEFDIRTGEVVKNVKLPLIGKAKNLQAYDIYIEDGDIYIEI